MAPDLSPARRCRAAPLSPDERRRVIVEAAIPLLVEHGMAVTTRQIAEAAGVAEGTLFRVFDDKAALLHAAAHGVLDPERARRAFAGVDRALSLDAMVRTVTELLLQRTEQFMAVLMALRSAGGGGPTSKSGPPAFVLESHRALLDILSELLEPFGVELRVPPDRAALLLRTLVFGSRQPWAAPDERLTGAEIAEAAVLAVTKQPKGRAN